MIGTVCGGAFTPPSGAELTGALPEIKIGMAAGDATVGACEEAFVGVTRRGTDLSRDGVSIRELVGD